MSMLILNMQHFGNIILSLYMITLERLGVNALLPKTKSVAVFLWNGTLLVRVRDSFIGTQMNLKAGWP
jgi:hypothetical protein